MSGYNPKDFSAKRAEAEDTQAVEVAPVTRADETSQRWAAAHNFRNRCDIELHEATERHQKAVAEEQAAWENLEVAAGRAPETGQVLVPPPSLRYGQNGRIG